MTLRWRLFPKYATLIIALVGGMLVASGGISLYFSYREIQEHLVALQREKAQAAAGRIEQYVLDIEHQLGWTALPQVGAGANPLEQRRFEYLKLLRQVPAIPEVAWIDASGREQLKVSRLAMDVSGADTDLSKDPKFREAKSGKTWYSPVYFRKETEPYMTISRPSGGGGVTIAEVNLKFVWEVVSRIKIGQAGLAFVVNAGGTLIAHPDISLVLQKTDMTKLAQVAAHVQSAQDDEAEPFLARDLKGVEMLSAHARIPTLNWAVFVELPLAEAFKPVYASIERMGLLLLAGLALSVLASFFLARLMVRPIRALQDGAAQIGAGNLEQKITVTTGDELQTLAGQFNSMAAQLKESYAGLERKVDERTREVTEALEQQTATAEILRVISSSPTDVQPVFDAIVTSAQRLIGGLSALVTTLNGDIVLLGAFTTTDTSGDDVVRSAYPAPLSQGSITSYLVQSRAPLQITDIETELRFADKLKEVARARGWHSMLAVPMIRDGELIGAISVSRREPGSFSEHQVGLIKTFADQAVIAIENVRLFHEIQETSHQLEIASKHKSEFLANMSHELRTPLNAIIGFSEVLLEKMFGEMNEKQEDYLKDIHSSGQHLLSLINDILDLAKVEAGRMELNLGAFHLPTAIDNALTLIRERALRHGIAASAEVAPELGELNADERKLKQILLNLLSNAVKFTPEGGSITVAARPLGTMVEIAVSDTGIGIAPEDQAAVFEEFRQVGTDYTRKAEGTGLGLALTRKLVELHGGTMRLASEIGKGSTFAFTLPLDGAAPRPAAVSV